MASPRTRGTPRGYGCIHPTRGAYLPRQTIRKVTNEGSCLPVKTRVAEPRDYPPRSTNYADSEQWPRADVGEEATGTKALSKVRPNNELDRPRLGMQQISSLPAANPLVIAGYPLPLGHRSPSQ